MYGAPGNIAFNSGRSGPLGPCSKLVVRIVGSLKYFAEAASARTLFLNSSGWKSRTNENNPVWWSSNSSAASSFRKRWYRSDMSLPPTAARGFSLHHRPKSLPTRIEQGGDTVSRLSDV